MCLSSILTPWPGNSLNVEKDCFNYRLSSAHVYIEQSFGVIVGRWSVFWRPVKCIVEKNAIFFAVCCKLHNFIIDDEHAFKIPSPMGADSGYHTKRADCISHLQDEFDIYESFHRI